MLPVSLTKLATIPNELIETPAQLGVGLYARQFPGFDSNLDSGMNFDYSNTMMTCILSDSSDCVLRRVWKVNLQQGNSSRITLHLISFPEPQPGGSTTMFHHARCTSILLRSKIICLHGWQHFCGRFKNIHFPGALPYKKNRKAAG